MSDKNPPGCCGAWVDRSCTCKPPREGHCTCLWCDCPPLEGRKR